MEKRNNTRSNSGLCTNNPRTIVTSYSNTIERPNSNTNIKHRTRPILDPSRTARSSSINIEKL
jgi:hypothetical protein